MSKSLVVSAEALRGGLGKVKGSVATKSSLPVLSNVLLSVKDGILSIASTNLEVSSLVQLECQANGDWAVTVPAKILSDWVSTIKGDITLGFDEVSQTLKPQAGKSKIEIKGIDADDFPSIEPKAATQVLQIQGWIFTEALSRVISATAKEGVAANPLLQGVYVCVSNNVLTMAAIDGYRLNVQHRDLEPNTSSDFAVVIPNSALSSTVLANVPKKEHDKLLKVTAIQASSSEYSQIGFEYGDATYYVRVLDGKFPDYERFVPPYSDHALYAKASVAELQSALKRINITAQAAGNIVTLYAKNENGETFLDIMSNATEIGNSQEIVYVSADEWLDDKKIAVNIGYIQEALSTIVYDTVVLRLDTPNSPLVLYSPNQAEGVALVMPMRIP